MRENIKAQLSTIFLVLLGALILCAPALYNGYPLVYMDTGTYISSGFTGEVPNDRPLMYGLFIRHSSMAFSLWFTIYTQSILLAVSLYIFLKEILSTEKKFTFYYLLILTLLTAFTSIGWYASQLMPDVFTSVLILSLVSLLIIKKLSLKKGVILSLLFVFSCTVHHSHLLIAITFSVVLLLFFLVTKIRKKDTFLNLKKIALIISFSVVSLFVTLTVNYTHNGGFKLSKGSHAFLMAHFVETGTIQEFLKENCNKPQFEDCRLCAYKDSLGKGSIDFLWNYNKSPFYKMGGWERTENEFNYLTQQMMTDPRYFVKNVFCSFRLGLSQLFLNNIGEGLCTYDANAAVSLEVHKRFTWEENAYFSSTQQKWNSLLSWLEKISETHFWVLISSVLLLLYYFFHVENKKNTLYYSGILIVFLVLLNSFITAGLNITYSRLESRVVWLVIMYTVVIIINKRALIVDTIKKQIQH